MITQDICKKKYLKSVKNGGKPHGGNEYNSYSIYEKVEYWADRGSNCCVISINQIHSKNIIIDLESLGFYVERCVYKRDSYTTKTLKIRYSEYDYLRLIYPDRGEDIFYSREYIIDNYSKLLATLPCSKYANLENHYKQYINNPESHPKYGRFSRKESFKDNINKWCPLHTDGFDRWIEVSKTIKQKKYNLSQYYSDNYEFENIFIYWSEYYIFENCFESPSIIETNSKIKDGLNKIKLTNELLSL